MIRIEELWSMEITVSGMAMPKRSTSGSCQREILRWLYGVCCRLGIWQYDEGSSLDMGQGQNASSLSLTTLSKQNL